MAKFFNGVKLCFVIMVTELGPPCSSTLMLFGCSLSVFTLNGWTLLCLTLLLGVGNMADLTTKGAVLNIFLA